MKAYNKSIMEYDDVILAVDYAEERGEKRGWERGWKEGEERGEKRGREIGEEIGRINFIQTCYKNGMSIEQIVRFIGIAEEQVYAILSK
jgi:predicted transposase YdaD